MKTRAAINTPKSVLRNVTPYSSRRRDISQIQNLFSRKLWTTYKVTPLYKFSQANSRRYSNSLAEHLKSKSKFFIEEFNARIKIVALRELGEIPGDPTPVVIGIQRAETRNNRNNLSKFSFVSILCGVGMDGTEIPASFTHFPFMLCHGPQVLHRVFIDWLQGEFDCCVSRLLISPRELLTLLCCLVTIDTDTDVATSLHYGLRDNSDFSRVSFSVPTSELLNIWFSIHNPENDQMEETDIKIFYSALEEFFNNLFALKLSNFQLCNISTPVANVSCQGKVKVKNQKQFLLCLYYLTQISLRELFISKTET